jgi:hypothetical protein
MKKMNKTIKKTLLISLITIMLAASSMAIFPVRAAEFSNWDVSGDWIILVNGIYIHDYTFTMTSIPDGTFTGTGNTPSSSPYYTVETISDGEIDGNTITFTTTYSGPHNIGYTATFVGTIAADGTMSGGSGSTGGITSWMNTEGTANSVVHVTIDGETIPAKITIFVPMIGNSIPQLPGPQGTYYDIMVDYTLIDGKVKICLPYDTEIEGDPHLYMYDPVDLNGDGTVNGKDIAMMQKAIKAGIDAEDDEFELYNINHDLAIDVADLLIVKDYATNGIIVNLGQDDLEQARLPWIDITSGFDPLTGYVCGYTDHFSGFGVRR